MDPVALAPAGTRAVTRCAIVLAAAALCAGCQLTRRVVTFDDRRPVATDEPVVVLQSTSLEVLDTTSSGGDVRGLRVRLIRRSQGDRWEAIVQTVRLVRIRGEIRDSIETVPLVALLDTARAPRFWGAAERAETKAGLARLAGAVGGDSARTPVPTEAAGRDTLDATLACAVLARSSRGCFHPGERYLLVVGNGSSSVELPLFVERRNILLSVSIGVAAILAFLVLSTV